MEKSWNFSIGAKGHGKIMEFYKQIEAAFKNPTGVYVN